MTDETPPPLPVLPVEASPDATGDAEAIAPPPTGAKATFVRLGAGLGIWLILGLPLMIALSVVFALISGISVASLLGQSANAEFAFFFAQSVALSASGLLGFYAVTRMEKRSLAAVGLPMSRKILSGTGAGFALGAAIMTAVIAVFAAAGWYRIVGRGDGMARFLLCALLFLFVAVSEEALFRGILFRTLEGWLGTYGAVGVSALIFGAVHQANPNGTPLAAFCIALEAGILLAAVYRLTNSLWWSIGLHWAWNLFQGPVYGAPVSGIDLPTLFRARVAGPILWTGGAFGPEAGLVAVLLATTVGLYLLFLAAQKGRIIPPFWKREQRGF